MSYRLALKQYLEIVKYVEHHKYCTKEDIQANLNENGIKASKRTLERYFHSLKNEFGIDIEYDKSKMGYYVNEENIRLNHFLKLVNIKHNTDILIDALKDAKENMEYISFEHGEELPGMHQIKDVLYAIKEQNKVHFQYHNFWRENSNDIDLEPYLLKEYSGRWYLIGYNEYVNDFRTYAIDRITKLLVSSDKFTRRKKDNPINMFDNVIGVSFGNEKPVCIKLLFEDFQGKYIESLPLHESQETTHTPEGLLVELYIIPNFELEQKILMHGETVKVLEPLSLRDKIQTRLKNALKLYK